MCSLSKWCFLGESHLSSRLQWNQILCVCVCVSDVLVNQMLWSEHICLYNSALLSFRDCYSLYVFSKGLIIILFAYICSRCSAVKVKLFRRVAEHFHFGVYATFSELGAAHWRSWDFWLLVLLVLLLWFLRLYLHYCSQWLFLQSISVPVTK